MYKTKPRPLPRRRQTRGFVITGSEDGVADPAVRVGARLVDIRIYSVGKERLHRVSVTA